MGEQAPFNRVKACRHGTFCYNVNDMYVGRSLDLYGEFSEGEASVFAQVLTPGMVALDVGANIGCHTVVMSELVGPSGFVFAFEPQRLVFQTLCANVALNSLVNVSCRAQAVGAAKGVTLVPVLDPWKVTNFGGLELERHDKGEPVEVVTVDSLKLKRCNLIKCDVEGMERAVLAGARETIRTQRPVLYVECDRPQYQDAIIRDLKDLNYRVYHHDPMLFNPDNHAGNPENVFGQIVSKNLFCLPAESGAAVEMGPGVGAPEVT